MLKLVLWGLVAVVASIGVLLIYASTIPGDFRISRSVKVNATAEKIFPLINDLRAFNRWNPFLKMDPDSKLEYAGNTEGPGASYRFVGGKSGTGRVDLVGASRPGRVEMMLHMEKPIEGHNKLVFSLQPQDGGTEVSWTMTGERPFIGKVLEVVFGMEKMVGKPFEQGLADLKALAEI